MHGKGSSGQTATDGRLNRGVAEIIPRAVEGFDAIHPKQGKRSLGGAL
jgi:hypothetical protein